VIVLRDKQDEFRLVAMLIGPRADSLCAKILASCAAEVFVDDRLRPGDLRHIIPMPRLAGPNPNEQLEKTEPKPEKEPDPWTPNIPQII